MSPLARDAAKLGLTVHQQRFSPEDHRDQPALSQGASVMMIPGAGLIAVAYNADFTFYLSPLSQEEELTVEELLSLDLDPGPRWSCENDRYAQEYCTFTSPGEFVAMCIENEWKPPTLTRGMTGWFPTGGLGSEEVDAPCYRDEHGQIVLVQEVTS